MSGTYLIHSFLNLLVNCNLTAFGIFIGSGRLNDSGDLALLFKSFERILKNIGR